MNHKFIIGILGIIMLISTTFLSADSSRTINYQGYLTDSSGEPVNGTIGVSFYIYESLLTQMWMWSESHTVECENGLFSVVLGQTTPFQDSVFNGEDRYLGIRIGDDSEISPRTLITAVPHAFISQQMSGDIETESGKLVMKDIDGDSVIVMESNFDGTKSIVGSIKMFNPQPEPPAKMFEVNADATSGASLNLYNEIGQVMGFEPTPFNDGYLMKFIDPGDDGKLLEMFGNHQSNEAGLYLIDPGDDGHIVSLTSSPTSGGSIKMFNPQPEPPALIMEIASDLSAKGGSASISVYDDTQLLESHLEPGILNLVSDAGGVPGPSINLTAASTYARVGIGNDSPNEPISIGANLGSYYGEFVQIGNTDAGRYSGFMCGEDENNRGTILWYNNDNQLRLGSRSAGSDYATTLVIKEDQVAINTTTPGSQELYVVGDIYATGTITELSDVSAKTNIETIGNALELVENLRGVRYNLHSRLAADMKTSADRQVGMIAQEVESILPEVVSSPADGYKSIDYSRLTAVLVEAVKELKAENEILKQRIEALENAR
ncbi:MAG TPA: tail fiber domain-containing protein [candidate division Zixibacteria bacterium]|nr:tail fiber domain-containing protein [candidate division Zixibacteria bacterium]HEQ98748.1 tail fiber domain-containing protein [candidate division Zixibacteria bacterium]